MIKKITLLIIFLISIKITDAQEIINISGNSITVQEFKNTLMKNNHNREITKEYLDEYVELFINYKLKVLQAKEMGLDREESFVSELEMYRKQLAKPYLQAKEFKEDLIDEAYERMRYDVSASHILFKLDENSTPSDTLLKYNIAKKVKSRIESKEITFEQAVSEYSEENFNNGNLGYFTAFDMVYNFETAVYTTTVGEVSDIVKTQYGYHLVKVNDKRPSVGEVKVSHIMFKFPKGGVDEKSSNLVKSKAVEVYNKLSSGEDFAVLADRYSEDRSTAVKGGELPWFGLNKMAKEFEEASFSLSNVGDFTQPFKTEYGWHIVILNDKKVIGSLDDHKEDIKRKIDKGSRNLLSELALLKRLKLDYNFNEHKYNKYRKNIVKESIDLDKLFAASLTNEDIKRYENDNRELFSLDDIVYTQEDFKNFILDYQESGLDFEMMYQRFVDFTCLEYEESKLEEKYPEYKTLLNEFRDGILLFDLTSTMVWTKAMEDTVGLQKYFETNRENYVWGDRVEANIYTCADYKVVSKLKRLLWKKSKNMVTIKDMQESINKDSPMNLQINSSKYSKGDNKFADQVKWIKGTTEIPTESDAIIFVEITDVIPSEEKDLSESKGKVISDYQNYLEEQWLLVLREDYVITLNKEVLYSIIK
ncbi:MAG: peptidylprolyl isomerase [Flavobacteriales bacterium]|nr:peptidylprolyl isomerase [Flavobacteriales bacterium]